MNSGSLPPFKTNKSLYIPLGTAIVLLVVRIFQGQTSPAHWRPGTAVLALVFLVMAIFFAAAAIKSFAWGRRKPASRWRLFGGSTAGLVMLAGVVVGLYAGALNGIAITEKAVTYNGGCRVSYYVDSGNFPVTHYDILIPSHHHQMEIAEDDYNTLSGKPQQAYVRSASAVCRYPVTVRYIPANSMVLDLQVHN